MSQEASKDFRLMSHYFAVSQTSTASLTEGEMISSQKTKDVEANEGEIALVQS